MKNLSAKKDSRCCLILGGNSDIGMALARRFAQGGFHLLLTARTPESFDFIFSTTLQKDFSVQVEWVIFEGSDVESHRDFCAHLPQAPDVVLCVFGYLGDQQKAQEDFAEAEKIIHANFTGQVSVLNLAASDMEQRKSGTIIGISSVAGDRGRQSNYFYGAAKAGFNAYLSGLRNRLFSSGVKVITVKPGYVRTKMTAGFTLPPFITASAEEVADKVWKAFSRKKNIVYVRPVWRWLMWVIKNIPEELFKRLKL